MTVSASSTLENYHGRYALDCQNTVLPASELPQADILGTFLAIRGLEVAPKRQAAYRALFDEVLSPHQSKKSVLAQGNNVHSEMRRFRTRSRQDPSIRDASLPARFPYARRADRVTPRRPPLESPLRVGVEGTPL
jgi:hypothetical protein